MTRKHYKAIAAIIARRAYDAEQSRITEQTASECAQFIAEDLARYLKSENTRFNVNLFMEATRPESHRHE